MPMALPFLPMIMGLGGAALSSVGNKGTNTSGSTSYTEQPQAAGFRNSLYGPYQDLLSKAQQPMYGQAEQAQFTNQLNKNTNQGLNSLASQIASRTGSVNSGAFASGAQDLMRNRIGQQSQYAASVPGLNKQAALSNTQNILGLGMNFAGKAPVNSATTGQTGQSQGFGANFMNALGPMMGFGASGGGAFGNLGSMFGGGSQGGGGNLPFQNTSSAGGFGNVFE